MNEDNSPGKNPRYTKDMIGWRRDFVLQKLSKGWSQTQIAKELQLHPATISLDVQFLREQAQQDLQTHIKETIPFEFKKSKQAISDLIFKANEILEKTNDERIQMQIINTLTNLHAANMNLNSEGNIIQQAYDKVQTLEEIQKRKVVFSDDNVKENEGKEKEDFQEDEEPGPTEQDEDLQEE
jgi:IS30 family transposase